MHYNTKMILYKGILVAVKPITDQFFVILNTLHTKKEISELLEFFRLNCKSFAITGGSQSN